MKLKMKWAAAAAAALLTCGVSAQADNYDLTYQAIETQMLIGDVSQFSSELDGAMTKAPAESAKNTEVSEKTPRIVLVEKGDAYGATLVDGKVIIPVVNTNLMDVSPQVELLQENGMKGITASDGKVLLPLPKERKDIKLVSNENGNTIWAFRENGKWGAYSKEGKKILPAVYDDILSGQDQIFVVKQKGLFGVADATGKVCVAPAYQKISAMNDGKVYAALSKDNVYTFLDLDGKPLSTRTYEDVKRVDEDIAAVKIADKWGYVTVDGKTLVDPKYDDIAPFHEGYGLAARDGQISIFDKSGTIVGKASGEKVMLPFYNGYAGIKNDGKCSYIKPNGEILATVNATKLMPFLHGSALFEKEKSRLGWGALLGIVKMVSSYGMYLPTVSSSDFFNKDYKFGYVNTKGEVYLPTTNDFNGPYYKDKVIVQIKGKWGYADREGKLIVPAEYKEISHWTGSAEDIVIVRNDKGYGYYKLGKGMIAEGFKKANRFSAEVDFQKKARVPGLAAVQTSDGKWGFLDEEGHMAIPAVYDKVLDGFSYGAACVSKGGEVGLIDKEGKAVIPFTKTLQEMWKLDEEHIAFKEKGKWGFMDVKGNRLVEPTYDRVC